MCEHPNNPYYTDTSMFKFWSKEILCGAGNLHLGTCNDDGLCICKAGYTHDLTYSRYRTCNLPTVLLPIWLGIQFTISVIIFIIIFKSFRESTSIARLTLLSNIICLLAHMLYCIFQFAFDYKANGWMLASLYVIVTCLSGSSSLALFSLISPLSAAARKPIIWLRNMMIFFFISFRVIDSVPLLMALVLYHDINDPSNDKGWNDTTEIFTLLAAAEGGFQASILILEGTRMINYIHELSQDLGSVAEAKSKKTSTYVQKLQVMINRIKLLMLPLMITLCAAPIIQLITNYVPFTYIFATLAVSTTPFFVYSTSKYASRSTEKTQSSTTSPSPDVPNTLLTIVMMRPQPSQVESAVKSEDRNPQSSARVASSNFG